MSLLQQLPHTVTHTRPDYDQDELGAQVSVQETVTAGVSCWIQNASMAEILAYQKVDTVVTHKVFFAEAIDLRPGDELQVTAGPSMVGDSLSLKAGPADRSAGKGVLYAAMVEASNNQRRT